jgi:hypothetical protein
VTPVDGVTKDYVLETLGLLGALPVWLAGGIAADFHVGRWTREHEDIDFVAFEDDRSSLTEELSILGFEKTDDDGWITRWTRQRRDIGEVSLAFMRRSGPNTGDLVITPEGSRGGRVATGVFPGVPGNLDLKRRKSIDGVWFKVVSAEDDWVFTHSFSKMHPGAEPGPTDLHNRALLESVLTEQDRERLRPLIGRRLPLEGLDAPR